MTAIILRQNGYFQALMTNSDLVTEVCEDYIFKKETPSVSGLCATLGTTPRTLKRLFEAFDRNPEAPDAPSANAMAVLANAIMHIEAITVESGLSGDFNAHMAKFVLSAYHERHEKHLQQSQTDNTVTIRLQSHQPTTIEELREYDRLEKEIEDQQAIELAAMGKNDENSPSDDELLI